MHMHVHMVHDVVSRRVALYIFLALLSVLFQLLLNGLKTDWPNARVLERMLNCTNRKRFRTKG